MKVPSTIWCFALLIAAVAAHGGDKCPEEQEWNWTIEHHLAHEDCDKFYKCAYGKPIEQSCPPGLYFNVQWWLCEWPENTDCGDRKVPDTTRKSNVRNVNTQGNGAGNVNGEHPTKCPSDQPTDWTIEELLVHPDCNKFYKCTYGKPIEQTCPSNLYFNIETWQCDWPENTECGDRREPGTPKPDENGSGENGNGNGDGNGSSEDSSGSNNGNGNGNGGGENGNSNSNENESDQNVIENKSDENGYATGNENGIGNGDNGNGNDNGDGHGHGNGDSNTIEVHHNGCPINGYIHRLLPHEWNCNKFYYCVRGEKVPARCPRDLHFNPKNQVCDWPRDAGCNKSSFNKHMLSSARQVFGN